MCADPGAEGEHGCDFGCPLGFGGVAGEGVQAKPAAVEGAMVGVPEEEICAKAIALLAAIARDCHVGEGLEGGQGAGVVQWGGTHERRGEEEDGDVEGGEGLRHVRSFGQPRGGPVSGDEGYHGGNGEGVGASGGPQVGAE